MSYRKGAAVLAASALLACAGLVRAAEPLAVTDASAGGLPPVATKASAGLTLDRPLMLAEVGPADTSIMGIADRLGAGRALGDSGIKIGGWVEGSWTYNFRDVQVNEGRVFDFETQDPTLNQLVVYVEKLVDMAGKNFQVGGRLEMMWGSDARVIHANGLFDHYGTLDGPNEQFDLTQAYIDLFFPVGNGLNIRAGKFVTLLGQEVINPNGNLFYSHSYLFGFAIPFTHTGAYLTYNVNDAWAVDFGFSRGWEQALEDNNGDAIDVFGRVSWLMDAKNSTKLLVTFIGGPERADNSEDYRYVLDVVFTTKLGDQLTLTVNGDYGWEENAGTDGEDASWYGVAGYLTYNLVKDMVDLNLRAEWFEDPDGARGLGTTNAVYEVSLGLDIKPLSSNRNFSTLRIRPEIRWDYADDDFFAGGTENDQWTFGIDAIFGF